MSPAPAAAARSAAGPVPLDLDARLCALLERSGRGEADSLAARLLPATSYGGKPSPAPWDGFYWLRIPAWLAESFGLTATSEGRDLMRDLGWIQYCVYGLFRVQDDLVDGDTAETPLAVQTNHLLVEAARCAARHFDGASPFWRVFAETIDATSRAIVTLDRLQRTAERPPHAELELYADLSACLKIAAAGVALAAGRRRDWERRISPALDRVAVTAQIVDDLWDLRDDLAGGRINYVAWYLGRPVFGTTPEAVEAVVASNLATTERLPRLLARAGRWVADAAEEMSELGCARAGACLAEYGEGLDTLRRRIVERRGALLEPGAGLSGA